MKRRDLVSGLAGLVLLGAAGQGQTPPAQQSQQSQQRQQQRPPVFRTTTELVTVDVIVVDDDGVPIRGLTRDDFTVRIDGEVRRVQALDFLEFGSSSGAEVSGTARRQTTTEQARADGASRGGRVVLVLVDDLSYPPSESAQLAGTADRLLATVSPDDLVGVMTTSGLGPAVSPTRDRSLLTAALQTRKLGGQFDDSTAPFYITREEAIEIGRGLDLSVASGVVARECAEVSLGEACDSIVMSMARNYASGLYHRTAAQMAAYANAMALLRAAPAPRVLVLVTNGVAAHVEHDLAGQLSQISAAAIEAGVQFYALIHEEQLPPLSGSFRRSEAQRQERRFLTSAARNVASAAGGEAFPIIGTPDRFLRRIASETSALYRLGVEAPADLKGRRFLEPRVTVRRDGAAVRVNKQAFAPGAAAAAVPIDDRLRLTIAQGGASFGVPIALATSLRRSETGTRLQLALNAEVPRTTPGPVTAMFALVDAAGAVVQMGRAEVKRASDADDYRLAVPIPFPPGVRQVRFAVADAGGSIGSLAHPVAPELPALGSFVASDLFTAWLDDVDTPRFLALETIPGSAIALRSTLELYPTVTPAPDVVVGLILAPVAGGERVFDREIRPSPGDDSRLIASAEIPVLHLAPGTYVLRAAIIEAGTEVGAITTTFRKR